METKKPDHLPSTIIAELDEVDDKVFKMKRNDNRSVELLEGRWEVRTTLQICFFLKKEKVANFHFSF